RPLGGLGLPLRLGALRRLSLPLRLGALRRLSLPLRLRPLGGLGLTPLLGALRRLSLPLRLGALLGLRVRGQLGRTLHLGQALHCGPQSRNRLLSSLLGLGGGLLGGALGLREPLGALLRTLHSGVGLFSGLLEPLGPLVRTLRRGLRLVLGLGQPRDFGLQAGNRLLVCAKTLVVLVGAHALHAGGHGLASRTRGGGVRFRLGRGALGLLRRLRRLDRWTWRLRIGAVGRPVRRPLIAIGKVLGSLRTRSAHVACVV